MNTTKKWDDEACAAACIEMRRAESLIAELEKEIAMRQKVMNTDGRSVNWGFVGDMKRINGLLTEALWSSGNESDTLKQASMDLKLKF